MTLAVFTPPRNPDQQDEIEETPRVLKTTLGDGYVQRVGDGINTILLKATLTWTNLKLAQGWQIINFFRSKDGATPFTYTLPWEGVSRTWVCSSWKYKPISGGFMTITEAIFEEAAPT